MKTVTIQIGNTDDKLPQDRWSKFVKGTTDAVNITARSIHFHGISPGDSPWQNACWVIEILPPYEDSLKAKLQRLAKIYDQDSIAYTEGKTTFLEAKPL